MSTVAMEQLTLLLFFAAAACSIALGLVACCLLLRDKINEHGRSILNGIDVGVEVLETHDDEAVRWDPGVVPQHLVGDALGQREYARNIPLREGEEHRQHLHPQGGEWGLRKGRGTTLTALHLQAEFGVLSDSIANREVLRQAGVKYLRKMGWQEGHIADRIYLIVELALTPRKSMVAARRMGQGHLVKRRRAAFHNVRLGLLGRLISAVGGLLGGGIK